MKFALLSVSYAGLFYKGPALSIEQQIRKARELGFDALAIETKRPVAFPLDLSKADRARIRQVAADEGIALCAVESMSNFTSRHMEERENNLAMMRTVLDLAEDLGVGLVKVFAAWPGLINDEEAVAMYGKTQPKMILADIQLADGSSGIDAVNDILADQPIPVIFITAFPERLLTGERPEPTFLVTKPFNPDMVKALISQALFFDEGSRAAA